MDVNQPESVIPVGDQPYRQPAERHHGESEDPARRDADATRGEDAAVDLAGALSDELSPDARKILDALGRQMETLRAELELAHKREAHDHEMAVAHPFLPVPNRREFLRELKHVIDHMEGLSPAPAVLVVHALNLGDIRRRLGRGAADAALVHFAGRLGGAIHPTDAVGSLCGEDFGVILLNGGDETVTRRVAEIRGHLAGDQFDWSDGPVYIHSAVGWAELRPGWTAEQAVAAADARLVADLKR